MPAPRSRPSRPARRRLSPRASDPRPLPSPVLFPEDRRQGRASATRKTGAGEELGQRAESSSGRGDRRRPRRAPRRSSRSTTAGSASPRPPSCAASSREADAAFSVVKNRLAKRAAADAGTEGLDDLLVGPTALTLIKGDPVTAAKTIPTSPRSTRCSPTRAGSWTAPPLDPDGFAAIAKLPGLDVLHGQLVGLTADAADRPGRRPRQPDLRPRAPARPDRRPGPGHRRGPGRRGRGTRRSRKPPRRGDGGRSGRRDFRGSPGR